MKKLIKTIQGADCEIFAIKNHQRILVGKATPIVEIYQTVISVDVLGGTTSECKAYCFSVIICTNPELDSRIDPAFMQGGLMYFDIQTLLKRKDDVYVPFSFHGINSFSIETAQKWVFNISDNSITQQLLAL